MRRKRELMPLEMGMSTMRYLPASGTAGLARSLVSGNSRVPWPPPMMTQRTLLMLMDWRPVCDIKIEFGGNFNADCRHEQAADSFLRKIIGRAVCRAEPKLSRDKFSR